MKTRIFNLGGNSLLVVLMVITTLSVCVLGAMNFTTTVSRNVERTNRHRESIEIGDGAIEYLFSHWREKCRPNPNVHHKAEVFAGIPMPAASLFPDVPNFAATNADDRSKTVSKLRIQALDATWQPVADSASVPPAHGMNYGMISYFYLASANVTLPNIFGEPTRVNLRRVMEKRIGSPWLYAIFYTDRLEIHPGPQFNVTGWVHTNERLFTNHKSLNFESKVTYGQDWEISYAPGDTIDHGKPVNDNDGIDEDEQGQPRHAANLPPALEQAQQPFGLDSTRIFSTADTNPNNDSYRELVERPSSGFPDPIAEARYYNQADVKLLVSNDGSGNPVLTVRNGSDQICSATSTGLNKALWEVFTDAVTMNEKIQDNREAKEIRLMTLDMAKINSALRPHHATTNPGLHAGKLTGTNVFNGVIYASDTTYTSANRRGVRLKNGAAMPPGGLTIATDNPCYIQGDYNTGTNGSTQPNSNASGGDPLQNIVPGYIKQSCAVVADAVQILSNAWTDANSSNGVASRVATPTTVNSAIVSGIVATTPGVYSGGAENFPRFMEKWGSGTTFTYHGSMVQLYASKQNTGAWGKPNVYDPPRRKWYFERQFYTDPPPGTLSLISYIKGRWYLE